MRDTLCRFHIIIDVFFLGRASKNVKAKANALRTELVKKRKVDKGTNAATWMPSNKRREINAWRDNIRY
jgi:hypothetical protein